jgi:ribosomal protein L37E
VSSSPARRVAALDIRGREVAEASRAKALAAPDLDALRERVDAAATRCPLCAQRAWVEIEREVYCSKCGFPLGEADLESYGADDAEREPPGEADRLTERNSSLAGLPYAIYAGEGDGVFITAWASGLEPAAVALQRLELGS